MRTLLYGLAPALLVAAGLGCSGHSTQSSHGDGGKVSEAGAIDSGSAVLDGARRLDVRDSKGLDLSATDAGVVRDARDGGIDSQSRDARDATGDAVALDLGNPDASFDGSRDGNRDPSQQPDVPVDTAPLRGTCALPIDIPFAASHIDLAVNTSSGQHILDFPCAINGGDIVFRIQSNQPEMAYADTFGTSLNTALFFTDTCDIPTPPDSSDMAVCNDDACGTSQSQAFAPLAYGFHYLIVSGVNGDSGDVIVHFQHAPLGNGPIAALPQGSATATGTVGGLDTTRTCDMAGPKNSYWWVSCPDDLGGNFHASTCDGADWDTALILQIPRLDTVSCNDDDLTCGVQSTVDTAITPGAGMFVLTVARTLMIRIGDLTNYTYTLTYTRP